MNAFVFRRRQRLLNAHDFKQVFDQVDIKLGNDSVLILARRIEPSSPGRLGLICAKKHLKLSVQRNRFKRQARESFRHLQDQLQGLDLIIMSRPGIRQCAPDALRSIFDQCLNRLIRRASSPPSPAKDSAPADKKASS